MLRHLAHSHGLVRRCTSELNPPRQLILWLTKRGDLSDGFARMAESRLIELARLEQQGKTAELDRIRVAAPNAIPSPAIRTIWGILLARQVRSRLAGKNLYGWLDRLKQSGLTALSALANAGEWPVERWREALQVWSAKEIARRSWRHVAPVMSKMPDPGGHPNSPSRGHLKIPQ